MKKSLIIFLFTANDIMTYFRVKRKTYHEFFFEGEMSGVSKIFAREIFDSRGNPSVEVDITTSKGE